MSAILSENLIPLQAAANSLPGQKNKKLNFVTVWRWVLNGILAVDGRRVKLEAVRLGGRWVTSTQAIERFSTALSTSAETETPVTTPAKEKRAGSAARKRLEKIGI